MRENLQWWRALYTHGDHRKASGWFGTQTEVQDWLAHAQNVSAAMRRTVRYETLSIDIEGTSEGVADAMRRLAVEGRVM